jgi:hypothetical protein
LRRPQRLFVLATGIVEYGLRPGSGAPARIIGTSHRFELELCVEGEELPIVAPTCRERNPADEHAGATRRRGYCVRLVQQRRRLVQLALVDPHGGQISERDRENTQRTGLTSDPNVLRGEQLPHVVVEESDRGTRGHPRQAQLWLPHVPLVAKSGERSSENRRTAGEALRQLHREAIEQKVSRPRRVRGGRSLSSRLGCGGEQPIAESACDARGRQRVEIGLPSESRIE